MMSAEKFEIEYNITGYCDCASDSGHCISTGNQKHEKHATPIYINTINICAGEKKANSKGRVLWHNNISSLYK